MPGSFARLSLFAAGTMVALAAAVAAPAATAATQPNAAQQVAALSAEVHAGTLLTNHGVTPACAHCQAKIVTTAPGSTTPLTTTLPAGYGPGDLALAYHLPANSVGAHGTIAIIDGGTDPNLESDVDKYRAQYGLPACTTANGCLSIHDYKGGPPLPPDTDPANLLEEQDIGVETSLDMEMASAACPGCHLVELQVPLSLLNEPTADDAINAFGTAVNTAAALGANATSMSYSFGTDTAQNTGPASQDMLHPGMAVLASSGDGGYEGDQHTGWPQNLSWVTSVGGTSLLMANPQGTAFTETAWSGSGSGCETDLPAAIGQPAKVSAYCGGHRAGSDVSAVADPGTGVAVYDSYHPAGYDNWLTVGGTSASSPFVAGLYARGSHPANLLGPNTLYSAQKGAFTDVRTGQNGPIHSCQSTEPQLCMAGKGWDGPTGVGSPNGLTGF